MKFSLLLFLSIILALPLSSNATMLHVPADYATIQGAINASVNGDTVLVASGTYMENVFFRNKKIVVASNYCLDPNPSFIESTIIDGSTPINPDTASCVIINGGQDSTAVLQGFTLMNGKGTKWVDIHGAGKYREGGGILIELSSPTIKNNIIRNNNCAKDITVVSAGGGGIRYGDGNPHIFNNIIMFNTGRYGAGVVSNYATGVIKNNFIYKNSGGQDYSGGGIWKYNNYSGGGQMVIENNTIVQNSSTLTGGGIFLESSTVTTIRNNIVWGNTQASGGQIKLQGATADATYNDVQGGITGNGNIDADPLFTEQNFYLQETSPCVDKGDSSEIYNDIEEQNHLGFALTPSKGTLLNDIGAFGGKLTAILTSTPLAVIERHTTVPTSIMLEQNYPNPFNPSTVISYSLSVPSNVTLKVYNVLGMEITTLINNERVSGGKHTITFDANNLASGIYWYRISDGKYMETKKMAFLK